MTKPIAWARNETNCRHTFSKHVHQILTILVFGTVEASQFRSPISPSYKYYTPIAPRVAVYTSWDIYRGMYYYFNLTLLRFKAHYYIDSHSK